LLFDVIGAAIALKRQRMHDFLAVVLSVLLASLLANQVLKPLIHRERPFVRNPQTAVIGQPPNDPSFPSGHAASAFAAAMSLSEVAPSGTVLWWSVAVAIAYSRVYVGVHYPIDVIAGALVGFACGVVVNRSFRLRASARR